MQVTINSASGLLLYLNRELLEEVTKSRNKCMFQQEQKGSYSRQFLIWQISSTNKHQCDMILVWYDTSNPLWLSSLLFFPVQGSSRRCLPGWFRGASHGSQWGRRLGHRSNSIIILMVLNGFHSSHHSHGYYPRGLLGKRGKYFMILGLSWFSCSC